MARSALVLAAGASAALRATQQLRLAFDAPRAFDPQVEVLEQTQLDYSEDSDCLCEEGRFWHATIAECVSQGDVGYECGFFPEAVRHRVCKEGLKCTERGAKLVKRYDLSGTGARPGVCWPCEGDCDAKSDATTSKEASGCETRHAISGEACAEVKVTVARKHAAVASHTATAKVGDVSATASADQSAEKEETVSATAKSCVSPESAAKLVAREDPTKLSASQADEARQQAAQVALERAVEKATEKAAEAAASGAQELAEKEAKSGAVRKAETEALAAAEKAASTAPPPSSGDAAAAMADVASNAAGDNQKAQKQAEVAQEQPAPEPRKMDDAAVEATKP